MGLLRRVALAAVLAVPAAGLMAGSATAAAKVPMRDGLPQATPASYPGMQHLKFRFGPIHITPGQNTIEIEPNKLRPQVPGFITRFVPNLVRTDGTIPRVDVLHLHHGVWLIDGRPTFAAGEEKTAVDLPQGFGFHSKPSDKWFMNYMLHNLTTDPDVVYITYDIDFVPDTAPAARSIRNVTTQWMDVEGVKAYPVFDATRAKGRKGRFTFPDMDPQAYPDGNIRNEWVADRDATLVQTAGHLHPGGLSTDLTLTRNGRTVRLFRSDAHYFEPAGAVSWDVVMETTPANWRVAIKKGDVLAVHGTYDVRKASWYESMAIMPVAITDTPAGGRDPFTTKVDRPGLFTHGHLAENRHHGGQPTVLRNPLKALDAPVTRTSLTLEGFVVNQGYVNDRPATTVVGTPLRFVNEDADADIYHTITACKAPCTADSGIAYPLADGPVDFDSGELGFGPPGFTAAANRKDWSTPADLPKGTYTWFCRVHPFMRGSFRVKAAKAKARSAVKAAASGSGAATS